MLVCSPDAAGLQLPEACIRSPRPVVGAPPPVGFSIPCLIGEA